MKENSLSFINTVPLERGKNKNLIKSRSAEGKIFGKINKKLSKVNWQIFRKELDIQKDSHGLHNTMGIILYFRLKKMI